MSDLRVRSLGLVDYQTTFDAMREFTLNRTDATQDELWVLQHTPVYTLGLSGKTEHLLNTAQIPVVQTDRGGQVTYHGPGQLMIYFLLDHKRRNLGARALVSLIETSLIETLQHFDIESYAKPDAPGVYVGDAKIAALGLKFKAKGTYHGLSLNIDMDLTPFKGINPCGYANLAAIQTTELNKNASFEALETQLVNVLINRLSNALDTRPYDPQSES